MPYRRLTRQRRRQVRPCPRVDMGRPGRQTSVVPLRGLKSLADYVIARRGELGLTQEEFARGGGIHVKTLQRIERGEITPRAKTIGAIDRAAGWESGSTRAIINGGEPTLPDSGEYGPGGLREKTIRDDFERRVMELDTIPIDERWTMIVAHRERHAAPSRSGSSMGQTG